MDTLEWLSILYTLSAFSYNTLQWQVNTVYSKSETRTIKHKRKYFDVTTLSLSLRFTLLFQLITNKHKRKYFDVTTLSLSLPFTLLFQLIKNYAHQCLGCLFSRSETDIKGYDNIATSWNCKHTLYTTNYWTQCLNAFFDFVIIGMTSQVRQVNKRPNAIDVYKHNTLKALSQA